MSCDLTRGWIQAISPQASGLLSVVSVPTLRVPSPRGDKSVASHSRLILDQSGQPRRNENTFPPVGSSKVPGLCPVACMKAHARP